MASKKRMGRAGAAHEFIRLMETGFQRHKKHEIFRDFCQLAAISLSNAVDLGQYEAREAQYMATIQRYTKDEAALFSQLLCCVVEALQAGFSDVLGDLFMRLELGNHWRGQFFSPYEIARLMSDVTMPDVGEGIKKKGYITVGDHAVGAGAMLISAAHALHDAGHNYQQVMHATGVDVDMTAVHMAYIQLSLLHMPGVVVHGNSLTAEEYSRWYTPAHILGGWGRRLRRDQEQGAELTLPDKPENVETRAPEPVRHAIAGEQLALFDWAI